MLLYYQLWGGVVVPGPTSSLQQQHDSALHAITVSGQVQKREFLILILGRFNEIIAAGVEPQSDLPRKVRAQRTDLPL